MANQLKLFKLPYDKKEMQHYKALEEVAENYARACKALVGRKCPENEAAVRFQRMCLDTLTNTKL